MEYIAHLRVSKDGSVAPRMIGAVKIEALSEIEAAEAVRKAYVDAKLIRANDQPVTVEIIERRKQ